MKQISDRLMSGKTVSVTAVVGVVPTRSPETGRR
jgi:hypothetical protein